VKTCGDSSSEQFLDASCFVWYTALRDQVTGWRFSWMLYPAFSCHGGQVLQVRLRPNAKKTKGYGYQPQFFPKTSWCATELLPVDEPGFCAGCSKWTFLLLSLVIVWLLTLDGGKFFCFCAGSLELSSSRRQSSDSEAHKLEGDSRGWEDWPQHQLPQKPPWCSIPEWYRGWGQICFCLFK
jgi:hypothetical protein